MPLEIDAVFQQFLAGVSPELNAYACYVPAELSGPTEVCAGEPVHGPCLGPASGL